MSLPAPNLDDRTFEELLEEARNRIPRFTPEWTNLNASDPGMTLVELHAWMTETILYRLNQVPDLNYVKFLDLLGITPLPAHPARAELALTLQKLDQPDDLLTVPIPRAAQFSVDDPDLSEVVTFETDRSFLALNADFGMVVAPAPMGSDFTRQLLTTYDEGAQWNRSVHPFGTPAEPGKAVYLGLLLRPNLAQEREKYTNDALPAGPLSLFADASQIDDPDTDGAPVPGPMPVSCGGAGLEGPRIAWQIYTGAETPSVFEDGSDTGWSDLNLSLDESVGLSRSGSVTLEIPRGAVAVPPRSLPDAFWQDMGLEKAPRTYDELINVLPRLQNPTEIADAWEDMGLSGVILDEIAACGTDSAEIITKLDALAEADKPDPSKLSQADWIQIDPSFDVALPMVEDTYRPLYWIRAIYRGAADEGMDPVAMLQELRLNTVRATQAATYREQRLGVSNARPSQRFTLPKTPVLIDPETNEPVLDLLVGEEDGWERVHDFYRSDADSAHYQLDPVNGVISFGDGQRGRIPLAGSAITALMYRVGGGKIGNVGPGTITKLKGKVTGLKEATNPRAAHDGSNAETLEAVKLRAPHELRHRDRAVTAEDFADLALRTPGVALHKVTTLARRAMSGDVMVPRDGAVTLVLLPKSDDARPVPTRAQLRAVCDWLEPRRLLTTELHLTQPSYADVTRLSADVTVTDDADFGTVSEAIYDRLLTFLHPITGGKDGTGWPFGAAIYHADIYDQILSIDGVARTSSLILNVAGGIPDKTRDITTLPQEALPVLERDVIKLVMRYA